MNFEAWLLTQTPEPRDIHIKPTWLTASPINSSINPSYPITQLPSAHVILFIGQVTYQVMNSIWQDYYSREKQDVLPGQIRS